MKRIVGAIIASLTLSLFGAAPTLAAVKAGLVCKKAGLTTIDSGRKYTCVKQGKKSLLQQSAGSYLVAEVSGSLGNQVTTEVAAVYLNPYLIG